MVAGKYMRAPPDASLADKGRAKGKKAVKKAGSGAAALQGFHKYNTPLGIQVSKFCMCCSLLSMVHTVLSAVALNDAELHV